MSSDRLNLFSFKGKYKTLHMSWMAFFLSFVVWFNMAPFATTIQRALHLTTGQLKTLFICNVVLTIPARIIVGMLVDRFGPRKTYSSLLAIMSIPCFMFAMADTFEELVIWRLLLGGMGAGFVVGIRMVGEWFPPKQIGVAEGIYGGWGNFGSAAAAFILPSVALLFSEASGWRLAIGLSGCLSMGFSILYYKTVRDTPAGKTYFSPKNIKALEVCKKGDLYGLIFMTAPMILCLAVLAWKLSLPAIGFITVETSYVIYGLLVLLFIYQVYQIISVNKERLQGEIKAEDKYDFKQVAILDLAYAVSFGSELAVVSMLPSFFEGTFKLTPVVAGMIAASFAFMNLVARPGGGILSDKFGRKKTMLILFLGLIISYFGMSQIEGSWFLPAAVLLTMCCSFFVQAAEGAVFSIVPLIKRRLTGQIAGMVGAYGNVGAVTFLTIYSFTDASTFFIVIGVAAIFSCIANLFITEPAGHGVEIQPDGSVEYLELA
ncbi:MAG: MFS transporter [SAR324 cluster bacterium]|uniref:Nitrate/nitrite transporter n=1 Tax=SAR324 cluster bacterium TaxID=2024889 RepID=A0A2A4T8T8_9DELT|nr:MAG: MFS transporter [SAR324 cluster bacterium]